MLRDQKCRAGRLAESERNAKGTLHRVEKRIVVDVVCAIADKGRQTQVERLSAAVVAKGREGIVCLRRTCGIRVRSASRRESERGWNVDEQRARAQQAPLFELLNRSRG